MALTHQGWIKAKHDHDMWTVEATGTILSHGADNWLDSRRRVWQH